MIPLIFRKPTLMTNYTEFSIFNKIKHNNFLMIFKLFFDEKKNKILTISEIFEKNLSSVFDTEILKKNNIKLLSNSSDEILNASIELEKIQNYDYKVKVLQTDLQKKFWGILEKYSIKNKYLIHNSIVSPYFLEKHQKELF